MTDSIDEALEAAGERKPLTQEQKRRVRYYDFMLWWVEFSITKQQALKRAAAEKALL